MRETMSEDINKDIRLKKFVREQIKQSLIKTGRRMVEEKGPEFLTARKLSEASNTSVGTIYNIFNTMDTFIIEENIQTLQELYTAITTIIPNENPYITINSYVDVFVSFVVGNRNLWMLLYKEHLQNPSVLDNNKYLRLLCKFERLVSIQITKMFNNLKKSERRAALQVLGLAIFALSGFVATSSELKLRKLNKANLCKLLLNTYLAGLDSLRKVHK